jgi:hypothetical protein
MDEPPPEDNSTAALYTAAARHMGPLDPTSFLERLPNSWSRFGRDAWHLVALMHNRWPLDRAAVTACIAALLHGRGPVVVVGLDDATADAATARLVRELVQPEPSAIGGVAPMLLPPADLDACLGTDVNWLCVAELLQHVPDTAATIRQAMLAFGQALLENDNSTQLLAFVQRMRRLPQPPLRRAGDDHPMWDTEQRRPHLAALTDRAAAAAGPHLPEFDPCNVVTAHLLRFVGDAVPANYQHAMQLALAADCETSLLNKSAAKRNRGGDGGASDTPEESPSKRRTHGD